ncbi:efflux RND transporter permease subunit [Candidatus Uabimicrobium amorphum]|uniref:Transporter n=1 Tax=Uabimicrobium amorphum TaxID=2596890 RepID=A0A5S9F5V7_UABAM|nr:MMPL family transporter [Candidatus Uabimicrobium amorphum]BBM85954.1 transporter [Candidatus Uabimicrobium amorphum]
MYQKLLHTIAGYTTTQYKKIFLICGILTIVLGSLAATLEINLSFLAIMPEDEELNRFKKVTAKFGASSDLLIAVESDNPQQSKKFARALEKAFDQARDAGTLSVVRSFRYKIDTDFYRKYGLLLTQNQQLEDLANFFEKNNYPLRATYRDLSLPGLLEKTYALLQFNSLQLDSLQAPKEQDIQKNLRQFRTWLDVMHMYVTQGSDVQSSQVKEKISSLFSAENRVFLDVDDGYIFSQDKKMLLIFMRLNVDLIEVPFGISFFEDIKRITQETVDQYPGITVGFSGMMATGYEDQAFTLNRFQWLSFLSLIMVTMLFFYISKLALGPILVAIPMLMAMVWTFGMVKIGIGFVSITSMIFAILLFGLGVDFAIHIMVRINEEYKKTLDYQVAIQQAVVTSGRGIITGGVTSAMAFFAMCVAEDKAANHLGFTTGWGLLSCMIVMVVFFPAILYLLLKGNKTKAYYGYKDNRFLTWWAQQIQRHPYNFLVLSIVALLFFGYQIRHFRMEYNLEKIIQRNIPSLETKRKVQAKFNRTNDFVMVTASDLEEDREFTQRLQKCDVFAEVMSISQLIPPMHKQRKRLKRIERIHEVVKELRARNVPGRDEVSSFDVARIILLLSRMQLDVVLVKEFIHSSQTMEVLNDIESQLRSLRRYIQKNDHIVRENLAYLESVIAQQAMQAVKTIKKLTTNIRPLTLQNLPGYFRERFESNTGDEFLIFAYPKDSSLDPDNIDEIERALQNIAPGKATGMLVITKKFVTGGLRDFPIILSAVLIVLVVILLLDFRSPKYLFFAILPLVFSGIISMGIICMSNVTISILMLSAFPLIFGIGIDDGVHIVHRFRENGDIIKTISETGRAILLTTITTLVSFGALLFTNHSGLIGLGILVGVGVSLCFVFSVTILPVALILFDQEKLPKE